MPFRRWSRTILRDERGGRFLVRIEDIDGVRSRPELAAEFRADLAWLGLEWEEVAGAIDAGLRPIRNAAERLKAGGSALSLQLHPRRDCTSGHKAGQKPPRAPGPLSRHLPGQRPAIRRIRRMAARHGRRRCRPRGAARVGRRARGRPSRRRPEIFGDVVLLRKEAPASYHPRRDARRCGGRRHPGDARNGLVRRDPCPPAAAGAAGPAGSGCGTTIRCCSTRAAPSSPSGAARLRWPTAGLPGEDGRALRRCAAPGRVARWHFARRSA